MISAEHLRSLRNDIPVLAIVLDLPLPTKWRGSRLTFRCPACGHFHTTLNHRANLATCFRCRRSFNAIDLVMAERGASFRAAVQYLEGLLRA